MKTNRLAHCGIRNVHMKFEIEIQKETEVIHWKPGRLQTDRRTNGQGESGITLQTPPTSLGVSV